MICNYFSFTRIPVKLKMWFWMGGRTVYNIPYYAKYPAWIHWGVKKRWQQGSLHKCMMKKSEKYNSYFSSPITSCNIALRLITKLYNYLPYLLAWTWCIGPNSPVELFKKLRVTFVCQVFYHFKLWNNPLPSWNISYSSNTNNLPGCQI